MELFIERATALAPETNVTEPEQAEAVIEICRRLDGIPLAIELAASRVLSMTVTELRDRLGDRFRLLVGSGRGSERHHTLRHAVQWSFDLLTGDEKELLARCSVFSGGFDLDAARVIAGSSDELATLDLLDGLMRKSLVVADRTLPRTGFSMLETIRQFGEEQLTSRNEAEAVRTAHARYFASRETEVLTLWDSPRQVEAYAWFNRELANLRAAFRWVADLGDLDSACAIAIYATILGFWVEQHEPTAWAEELIEVAAAATHRGSRSSMSWPASVTRRDGSNRLTATRRPAVRRSPAGDSIRCPTTPIVGSAAVTSWPDATINGSTYAEMCCGEVRNSIGMLRPIS